jgi:uncharacterized lipoprotein YddW (UPF0748 family)
MLRSRLLPALLASVVLAACASGPKASLPIPGLEPATPRAWSPAPDKPVQLSGPPSYRALWVDVLHDGIKTRKQVDELITKAHAANLNALFVQVRIRGDAYFRRGVEPLSRQLDGTWDPLAYVIQRAHAANPPIEVHAWLNTFYVSKGSEVYQLYGDRWGNKQADGGDQDFGYIDPGAPAARGYTQEVFLAVARNYNVDGIHMDYVRYPEGGDWGYSADGLAAFQQATGRTDRPAPDDGQFQQWRRDQVNAFVRGLHDALHRVRPRLKLSAALIAYGKGPKTLDDWRGTRTYNDVYQDWVSWLDRGYLDLAVVMNYDRDSSPTQKGWFRDWIEFEKDHQGQGRLIVGVGAFDNYPEDTMVQIRVALQPSQAGLTASGVALYSYASTSLYGTDDFYLNPNGQGYLPRQPYAPDTSPAVLAARAKFFNAWFFEALAKPSSYPDPALGTVDTTPVFDKPVAVPSS